MNTYSLRAVALCPNDGAAITYKITVASDTMLPVEDIIAAVEDLPSPIYQEDLTAKLAIALQRPVRVEASHQGVLVTSTAGGDG